MDSEECSTLTWDVDSTGKVVKEGSGIDAGRASDLEAGARAAIGVRSNAESSEVGFLGAMGFSIPGM
jgi:hypothetical protein